MKKLFYYIILLLIFFIWNCKDSALEKKEDPYRYNYPNYPNGGIYFHQSEYGHDCDDSLYWSGVHSKKFNINDSLYLTTTEIMGFLQEVPNLTIQENVLLECSNGDVEKVYLNLPYPLCTTNIDGVLPLFGGIPTRNSKIEKHNGFIDIQSDSIYIVAKYKSYWNGNIVTDTAYLYKFFK